MGKPHHATLTVLTLEQGVQRTRYRFLHAVVLMPLGDDLEGGTAVCTAIGNESAEEIQQRAGLQQSAHQHFQLQLLLADLLAVQQTPTSEA
ncbi:hypothetical protein D3C71_1130550 [compost metagenome]